MNTETKQIEQTKATKPNTQRKTKKRPLLNNSRAARIRTLIAMGHKPREIAALLGCDAQHVYNEGTKLRKAKKLAEVKSLKQKTALEEHVENLKQAQSVVFAGPEPKLSWSERFRILFTGVV